MPTRVAGVFYVSICLIRMLTCWEVLVFSSHSCTVVFAKTNIAGIAHILVPDGCCFWLQCSKLQDRRCD